LGNDISWQASVFAQALRGCEHIERNAAAGVLTTLGCHSAQAVQRGSVARPEAGGLSLRCERIAARATLPS